MKPFIAAIAAFSLFVVTCALASFIIVTTINSPELANGQLAEQSQLPSAPQVKEDLVQGGTLTSDYIPGSTPSASFESFVSAGELSGNGVEFTSVSLPELSSLTGSFAYISRKYDQSTSIFTMDVFTNHHVAEYEATHVEALNLFLIRGEKTQAKKNMAQWCQEQGPQTQQEAQAGTNKVICFGFLEVE